MSKYEYEYCKECGSRLIWEEEYDVCIYCKKNKQLKRGCLITTGDIFLMRLRKNE
jgi:hypothetical protein